MRRRQILELLAVHPYSAAYSYLCQLMHRQLAAHAIGGAVTDAQDATGLCQAL